MIGYLLILLFVLCNLGESITVKEYAKRYGSGGILMNAVIALFASVFFLITDKGGFYAPAQMIPLALVNSLLFAIGFYFTYVAFRIGPYGLTRLITSFSLLFTVFYGILFLDEPTSALTYIGLVLIASAMVLINYRKKTQEKEEGAISVQWLIFVCTSVVANGFIGILTRYQQIRFVNAC